MTEEESFKKIEQRIMELRNKKGMPQIELAVELNYEKSNISRLESVRVNPRITTQYMVTKALNVDLLYIVNVEHYFFSILARTKYFQNGYLYI